MDKQKIYVGTSGWHYKHWRGNFYPSGLKPGDFINYYTRYFSTAEINNSFYKLPSVETFTNWYKSVPVDFVFSVKASRFITHMKKLKDPKQSIERFMQHVTALEEKLGPILFQLPPRWRVNEERLAEFLAVLPPHYKYSFEFRDPSWYTSGVYKLLRKYNAAFCIYELGGHTSPLEVTADFAYVRLHGPEAKYTGSYSDGALKEWAGTCVQWQQQGLDVYIYFDNDQDGFAAFNALRLQELVNEHQGE